MAHRTHVFLYTYECGPIHFVTMSKVLTSLKQYRKGYTAKPWLLATCPWKRLHKINIWFSFCPLSVPCSSLFKLLLEEKRGGGERRNKQSSGGIGPCPHCFTSSWWKGHTAEWNFTKGKRVAYDLFVIGMIAKGHKTVEIITGCLGWQMPRISKETCMAEPPCTLHCGQLPQTLAGAAVATAEVNSHHSEK